MKSIFWKLGLICLIFVTSINNAGAQIKETGKEAADILRETMKAIGNLTAVEYEVQVNEERALFSYQGMKVQAKTKIIAAAGSPQRAVVRLQSLDGATYEMFTLNDKIMPYSAAGKIGVNDLSKAFKPLTGHPDLNVTSPMLIDQTFYAKIIEAGKIVYGGQEKIGDDLCDIIVQISSNTRGVYTDYYWISTRTKMPRARQTVSLTSRGSTLQPRRIITITKENPQITSDTFAYIPTEKDSVAPPKPAAETAESNAAASTSMEDRELTEWNGKPLPTLIGDDLSLKKTNFADVINKPTLITFWATWCGPCVKEMPSFQKMVEKYQGEFQVLAVGVMDLDRPDTINFIKKHPEYKFRFLLDPNWEQQNSPIRTTLGINALPTNILVDAKGKIVSAYRGERKESEWTQLIDKLVAK